MIMIILIGRKDNDIDIFDNDNNIDNAFKIPSVVTMMWLNVNLLLLRAGSDGKVEACGDESSGARGKMDFQEFPANSIFPLNQLDLQEFSEFWNFSKKFRVEWSPDTLDRSQNCLLSSLNVAFSWRLPQNGKRFLLYALLVVTVVKPFWKR